MKSDSKQNRQKTENTERPTTTFLKEQEENAGLYQSK